MRNLNIKQKKIIQEYYEQGLLVNNGRLVENEQELLEKLEKINDYETLWSDLDRLIWDLTFMSKTEDYKQVIRDFK